MSNFKNTLEGITNVCVVVGVVFLGFVIYRSYFNPVGMSPKHGDQLPRLGSYAWNSSSRTLVVAVRQGCHFCEDSMPFYRRLESLNNEHQINAHLIMVFPDSPQTAQQILKSQHLDIPVAAGITLSDLKVGGTPTLILTDGEGKVDKSWVGKQDADGEASVVKALQQ